MTKPRTELVKSAGVRTSSSSFVPSRSVGRRELETELLDDIKDGRVSGSIQVKQVTSHSVGESLV